jgi:hypothetical protein
VLEITGVMEHLHVAIDDASRAAPLSARSQ